VYGNAMQIYMMRADNKGVDYRIFNANANECSNLFTFGIFVNVYLKKNFKIINNGMKK